MSTVRVIIDPQNQTGWTVRHPDGFQVVLRPGEPYQDNDPIVRTFPWAFAADDTEQATRNPGEKRNVRRPE